MSSSLPISYALPGPVGLTRYDDDFPLTFSSLVAIPAPEFFLQAFRVNYDLVPYTRMTQATKWKKAPRRYLENRNNLKDALRLFSDKEKVVTGQAPFGLLFRQVRSSRMHTSDMDNALKAIMDAGNDILWPDDRWADEFAVSRCLGEKGILYFAYYLLPAGGGIIDHDLRSIFNSLDAVKIFDEK